MIGQLAEDMLNDKQFHAPSSITFRRLQILTLTLSIYDNKTSPVFNAVAIDSQIRNNSFKQETNSSKKY